MFALTEVVSLIGRNLEAIKILIDSGRLVTNIRDLSVSTLRPFA